MSVECDVAIVGAGPTGLTLANLLGRAGLRVVLVEKNDNTVSEPRGVSIDDEALRTMQATGLIDEVLKDVALDYGSHYFSPGGACFAKVEPVTREYGYPRRSAFSQPKLEATLRTGLSRFSHVECLFGWLCESATEDSLGVTLIVRHSDSQHRSIRAGYLVGCDGAKSVVRKFVGAQLVGSTYQQRWLIVDLADTREWFRQTRVICDPERPTISLPGPKGIRRYEFMLHGDETDERVTSPEFVRGLLAARGPDKDATLVRTQVYTFHARIADRWQTDRMFLAGDAAHLSPPFAGQGMNSGIRDADNLAWKLTEVVKGRVGTELLRTYQKERAPHAWKLIQLAMMMGRVMMPTSRLQATMIQLGFRLARSVPSFNAYFAEMRYKPKPYLEEGFLLPDDHGQLVGRMLPQPTLERLDGSLARMDDLIGRNFAVIAYGKNAAATISLAANAAQGIAQLCWLAVAPKIYNVDPSVPSFASAGRDVNGVFSKALSDASDILLFLRPDRYVAAVGRVSAEGSVDRFVASVKTLLANTQPSPSVDANPSRG